MKIYLCRYNIYIFDEVHVNHVDESPSLLVFKGASILTNEHDNMSIVK